MRLLKLTLSIALIVLSVSFNPALAQEDPDPLLIPTELSAIESDKGIYLRWRGQDGVMRYNIYHDGQWATTITFKDNPENPISVYKSYYDDKATTDTRISLVAIKGSDQTNDIQYSPQSEFIVAKPMPPKPSEAGVNPLGFIANSVESMLGIGGIGLSAKQGSVVCLEGIVYLRGADTKPTYKFCFEVDKAY